MNKHVQQLIQKEMTRKEFLTTIGFGLASIMGFSTLLRILGQGKRLPQLTNDYGYGSSVYGGPKD